jgi:hypothetical protein
MNSVQDISHLYCSTPLLESSKVEHFSCLSTVCPLLLITFLGLHGCSLSEVFIFMLSWRALYSMCVTCLYHLILYTASVVVIFIVMCLICGFYWLLFLSLCCCDWCSMHAVQLVCFVFHVKISFHSSGTVVPYSQTLTVFPVSTSSSRVESLRSMTDSPLAFNDPLGLLSVS